MNDPAARILAALDATPEKRDGYLMTNAADDLRRLVVLRDEARNRYRIARMRRLHAERVARRLEREAAQLRKAQR